MDNDICNKNESNIYIEYALNTHDPTKELIKISIARNKIIDEKIFNNMDTLI